MKMLVYKDTDGGMYPWFAREADGSEWSFKSWRAAVDFAVGCHAWDWKESVNSYVGDCHAS